MYVRRYRLLLPHLLKHDKQVNVCEEIPTTYHISLNSTFAFTIEFWANHSPDSNRPKGQIQYDMLPSNYDPSDLCVKIVYEVHNTQFGWVPVDCENQTAKAFTCCNQGVLYEARYKALLVLKKTNWYTADHICKEEGGTLFDTNNSIMTMMKASFAGSPWKEENVTEFWSALSLKESQDHEMCTLSRVIPPQSDLFQMYPQLVSDFVDSCEKAKHMSICMIPTLIYSEETTTNTFYYTTDFSSITTDTTQQHHTSGIIVIIVAACLASIASAVVLFSIVGRILSFLNKNMLQTEQRQSCPLENEIEIPSYNDDENLYSTNIIYGLPPLSYEGMIY
ncbi:unnamed protein product [Mytilus edulis]|uniref:C-type lectin domain-containing protein n=1 Tax=Mytilus edulis TaxID=6550 RepID=A0A8S3TZE9_MYTED|nr:unnamed protein product [Mytilus edulis]